MADRIVIVRVGDHLVSLPFEFIDEILGPDKIESTDNLPEGVISEDIIEASRDRTWVFSRGSWLQVENLLSEKGTGGTGTSQIVVIRWKETGRAFAVDQVLGIEATGEMAVFPERAYPYTDIPIAGVRFLQDGPVLELDLSRLISLNSGS